MRPSIAPGVDLSNLLLRAKESLTLSQQPEPDTDASLTPAKTNAILTER